MLSVILYQVFHKLWVAEVDDARVVLVQLGNLSHLVIAQREVEDVKVLRHTLLVARLRNSHDTALGEPAEGNLSSTLTIFRSDGSQRLALHDAVNTLSAKRSPRHHLRAKLSMNRFDVCLLDERVALQLVHHRLQLYVVCEVEETACLEVAHADGAHLASTIGLLHSPPRTEYVAMGRKDLGFKNRQQ